MSKMSAIFLSSLFLTAIMAFAPKAMATWYHVYPGGTCAGNNGSLAYCPVANLNTSSGWEMGVDNIQYAYVDAEATYTGNIYFSACNVSYANAGGSCGFTTRSTVLNTSYDYGSLTLPTAVGGTGVWDQFYVVVYTPGSNDNFSIISYGVDGT
jgi:hypothetical protein